MSDKPTLTLDDVRAIAELAKLQLSEADIATYANQLSQILEYFMLLQEVDTSHVAQTASVLPITTVLRPDDPHPALAPTQAILNAPDSEADQFKVNVVLGDE